MGCEDGLDAQPVDELLQFVDGHARGFQLNERVLEAAGLVVTDLAQILAAAANAVHFLGGVDHLEVGRKAANHLQCKIGIQVLDELGELFTRLFVFLAPANGAAPGVFDKVEQLVAALFLDQVADHCAQRAHVVAQGLVLVLEHDVLAT